jgi:hypothetical protein
VEDEIGHWKLEIRNLKIDLNLGENGYEHLPLPLGGVRRLKPSVSAKGNSHFRP